MEIQVSLGEVPEIRIPSLVFRGSGKLVCEGFLSFHLFYLLYFFSAWEMGKEDGTRCNSLKWSSAVIF